MESGGFREEMSGKDLVRNRSGSWCKMHPRKLSGTRNVVFTKQFEKKGKMCIWRGRQMTDFLYEGKNMYSKNQFNWEKWPFVTFVYTNTWSCIVYKVQWFVVGNEAKCTRTKRQAAPADSGHYVRKIKAKLLIENLQRMNNWKRKKKPLLLLSFLPPWCCCAVLTLFVLKVSLGGGRELEGKECWLGKARGWYG